MARPKPMPYGPVTVRDNFQIVPPPEVREAVGLQVGDQVWFFVYGGGDTRILMIPAPPPAPEGFQPPKGI